MPLDITFSLSDSDLDHFQAAVDKAKSALEGGDNAARVEAAARKMIEDAKSADLPSFIADRLASLEVVIDMVSDDEWQLSDEERRRIIGALTYFCDPEDLIPDDIPGLGFLDDAIYVEIVIRELKAEIDSYKEFAAFRSMEERRRTEQGLDPKVGREDWLANKRAAIRAGMRSRRGAGGGGGGGWRLRL